MKPSPNPVCNLAVPAAAANHNLVVLCNIGMKMRDSRTGACHASNVPDKMSVDAGLLYPVYAL